MRGGDRVGPYTILSVLGAGGMGVVYRARDERLDRDVAIKTLPPGALRGPARRRFNREALALAKVSHPNIAAVYDLVEDGESRFLVMECVPGRTLADRLAAGPLPPAEALALAADIAAALDAAHGRGVVHRDLKPGNVIVTPSGSAKVLDFGLAKLQRTDAAEPSPSQAETDTRGIVGTPLYMSPEQAENRLVDSRTDLWSLGVILYEALAGEVPFRGDSVLSVLRAVTEAPLRPLREVRPDASKDAAQIVERALEKDVSKRYQSASEMAHDLSAALARLGAPRSFARAEHRRIPWTMTAAVAGAFVLLAVFGGWLYHRSEWRRWAREEAVPEVARLKAADRPLAGFLLARRAATYLRDDPKLARLAEADTRLVSVTSSPPGATVEIQDYLSPEGAWFPLGTTPLDKVRIPDGYFRWRVAEAGFAQYTAAPVTTDAMRFPLDAQRSAPPGMSWVDGGPWLKMIGFIGWVGPYDLPAYYIDRLEVTNREYQAFVDGGGYEKPEYWTRPFEREGLRLAFDEAFALLRDRTGRPGPATWEGGHYPEGQGELPVTGVSWYEAVAFAAWAGKSLPTLAQWFRAAPDEVAWFTVSLSNFSGTALARAGAFAGLGPFGTRDMAGNAREWIDNEASRGRRFILGGAWNSQLYLAVDPEALPAFDRSPSNGFRCVRNTAPLPAAATGLITTEERDFARAKPAPDPVFRAYKALYAYDRTPLEAKVETVQEATDWREETVTLAAAYGRERLPVHLFLPKRVKPPFQTVVFFPSARVVFMPDSRNLGDVRFFDYVVQSGRALAYPVYQGTYERLVAPGLPALPGAAQTTQLITERYKDLGRTLDYLETRPEIDRSRLAYLGVSMGSAYGVIYATLVQERLRTAIFLDGGFFLHAPPAGVDQVDFAPRLKIPVLMVNGRFDFTFPLDKAQRPFFDMLGTPRADKRHVVLEAPHDVAMRRTELVPDVLGWLDRYLGRVE